MSREQWNAVDKYIEEKLAQQDDALLAALKDSDAAGLPPIAVAPAQGRLLGILVQATSSKNVLELGTLGGYSSIWLARALPANGKLVTLELSPKHAEVARGNFVRAGLADRVEIRVGPALDSLAKLLEEGHGPFDFVFMDADKETYPEYFAAVIKLARVGTLIVIDNVIRQGAVADPNATDARVLGIRQLNERIASEPRVTATSIQTVGTKGYDGLTFALVTG